MLTRTPSPPDPLWTVAQRFRSPFNLSDRPEAAGGGAAEDEGAALLEADAEGETEEDGGGYVIGSPPTYQTDHCQHSLSFTLPIGYVPWLVLPVVHW